MSALAETVKFAMETSKTEGAVCVLMHSAHLVLLLRQVQTFFTGQQ